MAETSITTNTDILLYEYGNERDLVRLCPPDRDPVEWWAARHTSGFRLVLDELAMRGVAEADITDTSNLKRPAAAAAMALALDVSSSGWDPDSDDGKKASRLRKRFRRMMETVAVNYKGAAQIRRRGRRSLEVS